MCRTFDPAKSYRSFRCAQPTTEITDYAEATAPFQEAVNNIYYAAAQNSNLVEISADVVASPQAIVKLLSSSTLKTFDLGMYAPCLVTHSQQRALAAGFSRNESLENLSLGVYNGATPSALRTIIPGLYRHPRLEYVFIDTTYLEKNDSELPGCIAQLLGSATRLRDFRLYGKGKPLPEEEDDDPLEIDTLFDVPVETTLEKLSFASVDIARGRSTHEESMLSVSAVEFRDCDFASSESLLLLSRLSRLEQLSIEGCSGLHLTFAGHEQSETRGPGPIEQLVEKHKCLTEISFNTHLNDHNIVDISQSLSHFDSLESLSLGPKVHIGTEAMNNLLLSSLRNNKGLRELRLSSFDNLWTLLALSISGGALRAMLRTNKALTHLDLRNARIDGETLQGLCDGLLDNATLKILDFPRVPPGGLSRIGEAIGSASNALEEARVTIHNSPTPDTNELRTFLRSLSRASGLKKLSLQTATDDRSAFPSFSTDDTEAASLLLKAAEMNPSLCELDTLLRGKFMTVEKKLHFQLKVNYFRRRLANFPIGLWPRVLAQMCGPDDYDVRYYFVRPEINEWGQDQRSLRHDAKKRASVSDDDSGSSSRKKQNQGRDVGDA